MRELVLLEERIKQKDNVEFGDPDITSHNHLSQKQLYSLDEVRENA
ncbi:hypothetical protein JXA12_04255 [Candidatus Woesearchaeota archaeon]|nr:hypothetical protein [Candidatus Woesearchaeota archaeon]